MIALMILIFFLLQGFILLCCAAAGNDAASQEISDQEQLEFIQAWKEKNAKKKAGILCECIAFFHLLLFSCFYFIRNNREVAVIF